MKFKVEQNEFLKGELLIFSQDRTILASLSKAQFATDEECEKTALLFSKSPLLLEMLNELIESYKTGNEDNYLMSNLIDKAETLIKQATEL